MLRSIGLVQCTAYAEPDCHSFGSWKMMRHMLNCESGKVPTQTYGISSTARRQWRLFVSRTDRSQNALVVDWIRKQTNLFSSVFACQLYRRSHVIINLGFLVKFWISIGIRNSIETIFFLPLQCNLNFLIWI